MLRKCTRTVVAGFSSAWLVESVKTSVYNRDFLEIRSAGARAWPTTSIEELNAFAKDQTGVDRMRSFAVQIDAKRSGGCSGGGWITIQHYPFHSKEEIAVFFHELGHHVEHHSFKNGWLTLTFLFGSMFWNRLYLAIFVPLVHGMCEYYFEQEADKFVPTQYQGALRQYFEDSIIEWKQILNDPIQRQHALDQSSIPFAGLRYSLAKWFLKDKFKAWCFTIDPYHPHFEDRIHYLSKQDRMQGHSSSLDVFLASILPEPKCID